MSSAIQNKSTKGVVKYSWIALFIAILSYCYNYVRIDRFLFCSPFNLLLCNGCCDSDSHLQPFLLFCHFDTFYLFLELWDPAVSFHGFGGPVFLSIVCDVQFIP